ncbi:MAG TPA: glycoside hydrolase domain-containing protein [Jiangellaceae bacterium]|nr:glycoside hydrolase domain-containing protein [Jiangellaceae bacterium]
MVLALVAGALVVSAPAVSAEPATPVTYPSHSSATRAIGSGFDTCTAPSLAALEAWRSSPYRTVNIYFGGINRGCAQPNLTATWVRDAAQMGWRLLPTYMGQQVACIFGTKPHRYTSGNAASYGTSDATDAIAQAKALGLRTGSALYADVEHYDRTISPSCGIAVRRYVSAWTKTLHAAGYLSGVYVHQNSGLVDLSAVYNSTSDARPDAVWMARWDGNPALTGWPTAPDSQWAVHQRIKQYVGDHNESWSGVTLNIDSDSLNAPVATVARYYEVIGTAPLNARTGPTFGHDVVASYVPGSTVGVLCQAPGQHVGTSPVWNRLTTGYWVSDMGLSTPSNTTYSAPLQRCSYPGQVTSSTPLTARTGPGASYPASGSALPTGSLAWVACQRAGSTVGTTQIWNRLIDGRWVTDYYVSNRSNTTWSVPVPRCY